MRCVYAALLLLPTIPANAQTPDDIVLKEGNICRGNSIDLGTLIVHHPANVPYSRWKEGNTYLNCPAGFSCSVSPADTATYTLEYCLSANGDTLSKDAKVIVWLDPHVTVPADTTVCRGTYVTLQAAASYAQYVMWHSGSSVYPNGAVPPPIENQAHVFVATARNDYCVRTSSATWVVEGLAPIRSAYVEYEREKLQMLCEGATIDLNTLLRYFIKDDEGVSFPATYLDGSATWTELDGQPVPDPSNYQIPEWAALIATVTASVSYTSVCDGPKTYTIPPTVLRPILEGKKTAASGSCNYRDCPGDPVEILLSLDTGCDDSIKDVNITYLGNNPGCSLSQSTPRERTYRCNSIPNGMQYRVYLKTAAIDTTMYLAPVPIDPPDINDWPDALCLGDSADFCITTDCDDILSVEWTVTPASASKPEWQSSASHLWCYRVTATEEATYTANIKYDRKGIATGKPDTTIALTLHLELQPPHFEMWASPQEICKGDSTYLAIRSTCDSIVNVGNWDITPTPLYVGRSKTTMIYKTAVTQNTTIRAQVTYHVSNQPAGTNKTADVTAELSVRNYPPGVSPASYNLCRGSADTARVLADYCDTIKNVVWKNKETGEVLSPQPPENPYFSKTPAEWQFILSPRDTITYVAEIEYMRSSETSTRKTEVAVFVSVRERPHILKEPVTAVCETDLEVMLNHYIDSALIDMNTINWIGYPTAIAPNLQDSPEKYYQVEARYAYLCSEMTTAEGSPEMLKVIFQTSTSPAFEAPTPGATYCQNYIPLRAVEQFTTYKWILPGGVEINQPDTVYNTPAAGTFTFTLTAENTCGIESTTNSVFLSALPHVEVKEPFSEICEGSTVTLALKDYERTGTVAWTPPFGNNIIEPVITVTESATYIVSVTNNPCPAAYDTIEINVILLAQVEAMDNINKCEKSELELSVKHWRGDNLDWVNAEGNGAYTPVEHTTFPVTAPGTYIVIASNRCNTATDTVQVTMTALPFVSVRKDTTACLGETITLVTESLNGTPAWFTDGRKIDSVVITTATPVVYTVVASNECGDSEPASITVLSRPSIAIKPAEMPAFKNNAYYDLRLSAENAVYPVSYTISGTLPAGLIFKTDGSIVGYPKLSGGNYHDYPLTIEVIDAGKCQTVYNYILSPAWSAPNAFIPGSSGLNSVFLSEFQLEIYDRRGNLIHEGLGWAGFDKSGRRAPSGTYFYKVIIPRNSQNHTSRYFSGYITVLPQ
ncbi:MAG: gliding motility-associated C-terminal domain-containing protein [Prevotellaceae bacterium]|jgi:hypothetical protein|nr:gliding motility-associated C-terminal domain-containing protein [Prevotellaceae bacterium]